MKKIFLVIVGVFAISTGLYGQANDRAIDATVLDQQGLPIPNATVTVTERQGSLNKSGVTTAETLRIDGLTPGIYDVRIEVEGFEVQQLSADIRNQQTASVEIRLQPERLSQEIVVAATRTEQRLGDLPASISVVSRADIRESPAVVMDDVLRRIPTFSLFRRTSSLSSHPTAQGVSLRSIGPSGVSRSLVLLDGIPFNDPFGGWVYWTRVPLMSVDRVELVESSNSSIYGNYAMGGVINIVTARPTPQTFVLTPQYGSRDNKKLDFLASDVWGKVGAVVEGSVFRTHGYPVIPERDFDGSILRGPVDTKATVDYENLNLKLDYSHSERISISFRGGYFSEERDNAKTCMQAVIACDETNDTLWKFMSGGIRALLNDDSDLQVRAFGNFETFHSSFLAVPAANPPRSIGRLTLLQRVPTKDTGFLVQWSKAYAGRHYFTAGADWRWTDGDSNENSYNQTTGLVQLQRVSGGTQKSLGFFVQDVISATPRLQLTLSARLDHWKNDDPHNLETGLNANDRPSCATVTDPAAQPCLDEKQNTVGSPRFGAIYHVSDRVSVWGALTSAFRAPTLNELYRQFSVGAVLTQANPDLGPERLVGTEAGVNVEAIRNLTWRTTWFLNRVKNPISNVTLATPANRRQRQNLGRTRIYGLQTDVEYRFWSDFRFSGSYLYDMATVREYAANPALVGSFLPQVPRHRGSVQLAYSHPLYASLAVSAQFASRQYEEAPIHPFDQNLLRLPGYGVVDFNATRVISNNLEAFFGVQNLLDREVYVQRNPTTIGTPRLLNVGVRISFRGR